MDNLVIPSPSVFNWETSTFSYPSHIIITYNGKEYNVKLRVSGNEIIYDINQDITNLAAAQFLLQPLYFPKEYSRLGLTKLNAPTFSIEHLNFIDNDDNQRCIRCWGDDDVKRLNCVGCDCRAYYHPDCYLEAGKESPTIYRRCLYCKDKNPNALPSVVIKQPRTPMEVIFYPITQSLVDAYKSEFEILTRMKSFHTYYINNIADKQINEINNPYDAYLYNVFQFFFADFIIGDDEDELLKTLYIAGASGLIQACKETDYTKERDFKLIYRDEKRYKCLEVWFMEKYEIVDLLLERLEECPTDFPDEFVFNCCLQKPIKYALGNTSNYYFEKFYENREDDLLASMLTRDTDLLRDEMVKFFDDYSDEVIGRIMGYEGYNSNIRWLYADENGNVAHKVYCVNWTTEIELDYR